MRRRRYKEWKNGTYPNWTARVIWFQGPPDAHRSIRLLLEDCERNVNVYPSTKEWANTLFNEFKRRAPAEGERVPFVEDFVDDFGLGDDA